ncbi:MAG: hypothetical protein EXR48_06625 [Dehalococcoidia bacterium]|nr:hypothetical protein [Dehalococcoidia bacterium]
MSLPLYSNSNYKLAREASETVSEFVRRENGRVVAGWEMAVPARGPDGFPYAIIFSGPTNEERGSAIRLRMAAKRGVLPDSAEVVLEAMSKEKPQPQVAFHARYGDFAAIPDQHAKDAALSVQKRAEAGEHYRIRLSVSVPEGSPEPDPAADESYFEIEVFKHWRNIGA